MWPEKVERRFDTMPRSGPVTLTLHIERLFQLLFFRVGVIFPAFGLESPEPNSFSKIKLLRFNRLVYSRRYASPCRITWPENHCIPTAHNCRIIDCITAKGHKL